MLLCLCSIYVNEAVIKYTLAFSSQASINLPFLSLPHHFFFCTSRLYLPVRALHSGSLQVTDFQPIHQYFKYFNTVFFQHELFGRHGSWA